MSSGSSIKYAGAVAALLIAATLAFAPNLAALSGSGNVTDYIALTPVTSSLSPLSATAVSDSAGIATSGTSAFNVSNAGSNVDTFVFYGWSTPPTYGPSALSSITLRGTTHHISDLLWFRQETISSLGVASKADYWSPLVIKSAADVTRATFSGVGAGCASWANQPGGTFASSGTLTFKYYTEATANDLPSTSPAFHFCVDQTNSRVYMNTAADFSGATLVHLYTTNSAANLATNYQYEFEMSGLTNGNRYCLVGLDGSDATATPRLQQCSKLPYEMTGETAARLYPLYDPPQYFPSSNQGGAIAFTITATQWNPYADTTNTA